MLNLPVRQLCAYAVVTLFVVFFFSSGLSHTFDDHVSFMSNRPRFPDFSHYPELQTLPPHAFPTDDPKRRIFVVGDIHGMNVSLTKLLNKVLYNPSSDVLIHVGDILTKGSHNGSMKVLEFMTSRNITGVRGNHDQKVIEWRAWMVWIRKQPGGRRWLDRVLVQWKAVGMPGNDAWIGKDTRGKDKKWWRLIPRGWEVFGDHFTIAQAMSNEQYEYLLHLPVIIHVPTAHTYIVHAGILPSDPEHPYNSPRQPLTRVPQIPEGRKSTSHEKEMELRTLQELSILIQVPQNVVPYNNLNIRGVVRGKVTRKNDGQPWSTLWQHDMQHCTGFNNTVGTISKDGSLPCYPATVIYGHSASRGLDLKRWSVGLDSGCVYERRLSTLMLEFDTGNKVSGIRRDKNGDDYEKYEDVTSGKTTIDVERIPFGASYHGRIISVSCP